MGRVAKFGQYLTNDPTTVAAKTRKKGAARPPGKCAKRKARAMNSN